MTIPRGGRVPDWTEDGELDRYLKDREEREQNEEEDKEDEDE